MDRTRWDWVGLSGTGVGLGGTRRDWVGPGRTERDLVLLVGPGCLGGTGHGKLDLTGKKGFLLTLVGPVPYIFTVSFRGPKSIFFITFFITKIS